jgi:hypothetical protein
MRKQKVVGLVTFKNESRYLGIAVRSLLNFCDEVLGCDDNSTDNSRDVFLDSGGVLTGLHRTHEWGQGGEWELRQGLLDAGRSQGGTIFVCIDADEAIVASNPDRLRERLVQLEPGGSLALPWIHLWGSALTYQCGRHPWRGLAKAVAFRDAPQLSYGWAPMHVARVPAGCIDVGAGLGDGNAALLHFQFLDWQGLQVKQAWYRCQEWLALAPSERTRWRAIRLNAKYSHTLSQRQGRLCRLPEAWHLEDAALTSTGDESREPWREEQILHWMEIHGPTLFEPLDMWSSQALYDRFLDQTGRVPRPLAVPLPILSLASRLKSSCRKWTQR